jgi:hypothetical protein
MNGLSQLEEYLTASNIDFKPYPDGGILLSAQQGLSTAIGVMEDADGWMYADACFPLSVENVARVDELVDAISWRSPPMRQGDLRHRQNDTLHVTYNFSSREATGAIERFIELVDRYLIPKPHMNVGTIGHVDHGKTTLTAASSNVSTWLGRATRRRVEAVDEHRQRS